MDFNFSLYLFYTVEMPDKFISESRQIYTIEFDISVHYMI